MTHRTDAQKCECNNLQKGSIIKLTDDRKCVVCGRDWSCGGTPHTTSSDWEESLYIEVMEDYVVTAELGHLAKDQKKHKEEMRAHFANLKSFIRTEIANARREEREMIRNKIKNLIIADDTWAKETKKAILGWCFPAELNQSFLTIVGEDKKSV